MNAKFPHRATLVVLVLVASLPFMMAPAGVALAVCDPDVEYQARMQAIAALSTNWSLQTGNEIGYVAHITVTPQNLAAVAKIFHVEAVSGEQSLDTMATRLVARLTNKGLQETTTIASGEQASLQIKVQKGKYDPCPPPPAGFSKLGGKTVQMAMLGHGSLTIWYFGGLFVLALGVGGFILLARRRKLAGAFAILIIFVVPTSLSHQGVRAEAAGVSQGDNRQIEQAGESSENPEGQAYKANPREYSVQQVAQVSGLSSIRESRVLGIEQWSVVWVIPIFTLAICALVCRYLGQPVRQPVKRRNY